MPASTLKKIDLLMEKNVQGQLVIALVLQYEESLWSVSLTKPEKAIQLLPNKDLVMIKRPMVRSMRHTNCVFQGI